MQDDRDARAAAAKERRRRRSSLAAFFGLFAILTYRWWSAAGSATSAGNHPSDARLHVWILAWVSHALFSAPRSLFDAPIYFPAPGQLTGSEHFLSSQLVFAPLYGLTGNALLAANAIALLSYPLAGFAMERLLAAMRFSAAAAWVGGLLFALGPFRVPGSLQLPQLLNFYLPAVALAVLRLRERPDARRTAALTAWLCLGLFSSYYMSAMVGVTAAVWSALELFRARPGRLRFLAAAAGAGLVSIALLASFSRPYFARETPASLSARSTGSPPVAAHDAATAATSPLTSTPWPVLAPLIWLPEERVTPALAAVGLLALGVSGLRRSALAGLLFVALGAGFFLAVVAAGGMSPAVAAVFGFFRFINRSQVLTGFGLCLLAAAALEAGRRLLGAGFGRAIALGAAALLLWIEGGSIVTPQLDPVGLAPAARPAYDRVGEIAAAAGGGTLLELPVSGRDGEDLRPQAMLGALHHHLPLANGFSGHLPLHFLVINNRTAMLPDDGALDDLVDLTHLRWLLLRPAADWKDPGERTRFLDAFLAMPAISRSDVAGFTLLRIDRAPSHQAWFDAVAAGKGFGALPRADREHLEPWVREPERSP